ncbi:MAG: DUF4405 domain-containing protein [Armatimonadetes bacterium]|nr:DUF4405 domain-containing protein [Armatimonadota bacterium]
MLFLAGLGLAISGFVRWLILPGAGRGGWREGESVFIFTRHTWTDLHQWLAVIFSVLVVIHLCLHWNWLVATTKRLFGQRKR